VLEPGRDGHLTEVHAGTPAASTSRRWQAGLERRVRNDPRQFYEQQTAEHRRRVTLVL
jgi:hypothetical protein